MPPVAQLAPTNNRGVPALDISGTTGGALAAGGATQEHTNVHENGKEVTFQANDIVDRGRDIDITPPAHITDVKDSEDDDCVMVERSGNTPDEEESGEPVENIDKAAEANSDLPVKTARRRMLRTRA